MPCSPLPQTAFKTPWLKAVGGVGSCGHELPILLARCPAINAVPSFTTAWCQRVDYCTQASRPKSGRVTLWGVEEIPWAEFQPCTWQREFSPSHPAGMAQSWTVWPAVQSLSLSLSRSQKKRAEVERRGGLDTPISNLKTNYYACYLWAWVWGKWWGRQFLLPILLYYIFTRCVCFHNKVCLHVEIIIKWDFISLSIKVTFLQALAL